MLKALGDLRSDQMIHRYPDAASSDMGPTEGRPSAFWSSAAWKQISPLQYTWITHVIHFYANMGNTQTHTRVYTCGKSQFPSDPGPHLTQRQKHQIISMELFSPVEGNLIHTAWWEHTHRATPSLTPTLQPSVNVRPWERGFILERRGIFTPSLLPLSSTHTPTQTGSSNASHPVTDLGQCTASLCATWMFLLWDIFHVFVTCSNMLSEAA